MECRTLEDDYLNDWSIQHQLNNVLSEEVYSKLGIEESNNTYSVPTSRRLIPPNMINDVHNRDIFIVKKGLIIYHMAIYDAEKDFDYPKPNSFFSTTPRHGIYITFNEKLEESKNPSKKIQLFKYQLTEDLKVVDMPGDDYKCDRKDIDGVVAGYYYLTDSFKNLNELKICSEPSDKMKLLEKYEISKDIIMKGLDTDFKDTVNAQLIWSSICSDITPGSKWRYSSSDLGRLYLYEYLNGKMDLYFRLSLFSDSHIYCLFNDYKDIIAVLNIRFISSGITITGLYDLSNYRVVNNIKFLIKQIGEKYNLVAAMRGDDVSDKVIYMDDELYAVLNKNK